jgi:3'(2'), 5'-bisphosphate nucleotidase
MTHAELTSFLTCAERAARVAGEKILAVAESIGEVTDKSDGSPVTRADHDAHHAIVPLLAELSPAFPIISEEGDLLAGPQKSTSVYWLVDPLDGTKEFIKGLSDYTVNIALIDQGTPVLGVVFLPATGVLYSACREQGAWRTDGAGLRIAIHAATETRDKRPVTAVVSRSHLSPETSTFLEKLGIANVTAHGSSLKMCVVADGSADIYPRFGPTCYWDTAAGAAVALEAGCAVVDLQGKPLTYDLAHGIKHSGFMVYAPATCRPFQA